MITLVKNTVIKAVVNNLIKNESQQITIKNNQINDPVIDCALDRKRPFTKSNNSMAIPLYFVAYTNILKRIYKFVSCNRNYPGL